MDIYKSHFKKINFLDYYDDKGVLAGGSDDGTISVWDVKENKQLKKIYCNSDLGIKITKFVRTKYEH